MGKEGNREWSGEVVRIKKFRMIKLNEIVKIKALKFPDILHYEWEVIDDNEFESNSITYQYPTELKIAAVKALARLKEEVAKNRFPFNASIISHIKR
ncbi:hypothetical protein [Peribacillus sp. FSL E2-0218]|uniref:hypothetical protein n=1 Tax=Peribacillus sp. FSL E2-0218 TaxID=2921364 RepID=UPI000A8281E6